MSNNTQMTCPQCKAAMKHISRHPSDPAEDIFTGTCGHTWKRYDDDVCPECGSRGDDPNGTNLTNCNTCGGNMV